jgi:diguanylate cyclase (GGDEF)-like protein
MVIIGVHLNKENDLSDYLYAETTDTQIHTKMALIQMSRIAQIFYDEDINTPEVREIMYVALHTNDKKQLDALRKKLYMLLKSSYSYFQKNGVRQLHFHLPQAISFLRFHKPQKFGDSLWKIRESIAYVNENRMPISCYEEGRIFNGFRNVFPLFKGNTFIGSVEISYSFLALQKELLAIDSTSYMFLVSKKVADKKLFKTELSHYAVSEFQNFFYDKATLQDVMEFRLDKIYAINKKIASGIQTRLEKGEMFSLYFSDEQIYNGKKIVITFIPVQNLDSKTVAYIIHYKFDKFLELLLHKIDMLFGILTIMIILISLMFMMYLVYYKKKQDIIKRQATHDALTHVYNRYGINDILRYKIEEYQRYQKVFSIIFFDIDFFKKINDTYGHDMGDYVLQNIAKLATTQIRSSDAFGRWGGEEFIVILPETSLTEAINVAEKLRKTIEKEAFGIVQKVTCSFGVTEVRETDNMTTLLKRVDKYLYIAKETGRNRVIFDEVNNS